MDKTPGQHSLGKWGEAFAARFLMQKGYEILEKNFKCPLGEIDLIAQESGEIVFIEVKTRRSASFGFPEEQLSWKKRRKLGRLAQFYFKKHAFERPGRIDVVAILSDGRGRALSIEVIQNAFSPLLKG